MPNPVVLIIGHLLFISEGDGDADKKEKVEDVENAETAAS